MSAFLTSVEICAGAGGQAIGVEAAGFHHLALVEIDRHACETLRLNRPEWNVVEGDVKGLSGADLGGKKARVDLLAGGVPCPPFSVAGKRLGKLDERDLFPEVVRLVGDLKPRALMIENVKGLMAERFAAYRAEIEAELRDLGMVVVMWDVVEAANFGVPQRRPRSILIALEPKAAARFVQPRESIETLTVAAALLPHLEHWKHRHEWAVRADEVAPTLVGGSRKHGGADLGPTGAKKAWARLGVNAHLVAEEGPDPDHSGPITLTVEHAAAIQAFPGDWIFAGGKTARYRQVGNAFPPPVAKAFAESIARALTATG